MAHPIELPFCKLIPSFIRVCIVGICLPSFNEIFVFQSWEQAILIGQHFEYLQTGERTTYILFLPNLTLFAFIVLRWMKLFPTVNLRPKLRHTCKVSKSNMSKAKAHGRRIFVKGQLSDETSRKYVGGITETSLFFVFFFCFFVNFLKNNGNITN